MSRATRARGLLGHKARHYPPDHPEVIDAKAELAEAKMTDFIERTLATAPKMTDARRQRIAALLLAGGDLSD